MPVGLTDREPGGQRVQPISGLLAGFGRAANGASTVLSRASSMAPAIGVMP